MHDKKEHRARRKVWDLALNSKNLELYEMNARTSIQVWLDKVSAVAVMRGALDVSLYMSLLTFDNMTKTGFSVDSGAVKLGTKHHLIHLMEVSFARIAASANSIWPLLIIKNLQLREGESRFNMATYDMCLTREVPFPGTVHLCAGRRLTISGSDQRPERYHAALPR